MQSIVDADCFVSQLKVFKSNADHQWWARGGNDINLPEDNTAASSHVSIDAWLWKQSGNLLCHLCPWCSAKAWNSWPQEKSFVCIVKQNLWCCQKSIVHADWLISHSIATFAALHWSPSCCHCGHIFIAMQGETSKKSALQCECYADWNVSNCVSTKSERWILARSVSSDTCILQGGFLSRCSHAPDAHHNFQTETQKLMDLKGVRLAGNKSSTLKWEAQFGFAANVQPHWKPLWHMKRDICDWAARLKHHKMQSAAANANNCLMCFLTLSLSQQQKMNWQLNVISCLPTVNIDNKQQRLTDSQQIVGACSETTVLW